MSRVGERDGHVFDPDLFRGQRTGRPVSRAERTKKNWLHGFDPSRYSYMYADSWPMADDVARGRYRAIRSGLITTAGSDSFRPPSR
eukprot:1434738-Prymnesium_polylepis.1